MTKAEKQADGRLKVFMQPAKGGDETAVDADVLLVCVGRRPYTNDLGLDVCLPD